MTFADTASEVSAHLLMEVSSALRLGLYVSRGPGYRCRIIHRVLQKWADSDIGGHRQYYVKHTRLV